MGISTTADGQGWAGFDVYDLAYERSQGKTDRQIYDQLMAEGFSASQPAGSSTRIGPDAWSALVAATSAPPTTPDEPEAVAGGTGYAGGTGTQAVPNKETSASWQSSFTPDLQQVNTIAPRNNENLYEPTAPNAGGDRNNSSSQPLDYTWRWEDMQSGSAASGTSTAQDTSKSEDDSEESFSDSWRKYTASGQPLAGSIFGG